MKEKHWDENDNCLLCGNHMRGHWQGCPAPLSQTEREHECYDGCWEFHCGKCGKFVCECQTGKIINDYKNRPQTERKCCEKCLQHYGLDNWDCLDKLCPCHTQGRCIITKPYRPTKEQNTRP